jgi:hypothetical protein
MLEQDAEKVRQQKKPVIWFLSFVWLNQMNQINKTNQFEHPAPSKRQRHSSIFHRHVSYEPSFPAACKTRVTCETSPYLSRCSRQSRPFRLSRAMAIAAEVFISHAG